MWVYVAGKEKVVKLPAWLQDNPEYNLKVGAIVDRITSETIKHNKKLIRLGKSYTKAVL